MRSTALSIALGLTVMLALTPGIARADDTEAAASDPSPPRLRDDLAVYHRGVTTQSADAQAWFDQGLVLYFGFNHEAAIASFARAAEIDSSCAMAWWGQAVSAGPNINNPDVEEEMARVAWETSRRALEEIENASPVEQTLIRAVAARYAWPAPEDRRPLDEAYASAMRDAWTAHPDDPDVGALFAEAVMDLRPWDLWSQEGEPRPETPEVMETLETILAAVPNHPLACHLYIHTMEASPWPEKAVAAADVLRDRIPGAGHLLHMPAHIDIRRGHYADAIIANQRAIEADRSWAEKGGFYTMYRAHNFHFLAYAAMFEGRRDLAVNAAHEMIEQVPLEVVRAYPDFLDGFMAVPVHVMVRFGLWEDLLEEPQPPEDLLVTTAFWRYGRTVALSALGRVKEADEEFEKLQAAYDAVPESRLIGNNTALAVLDVGMPMAEGELEYRRGNHDRAFELLGEAVQRDVALKYDEPWGWMMPVRHALGALLTEQKRYEEAAAVYRADLELHPDNGWALHGLAECLRHTGEEKEAAKQAKAFEAAWANADIKIKGSCYCRRNFE